MTRNGVKLFGGLLLAGAMAVQAQNPIHVTYQWHMHQPIYYPYESVQATDNANRFSFSVAGVHNERSGNYNEWPKNAIQQGADRNMAHAGAQASFSGSLMENLTGLWGTGFRNHWRHARNTLRTSLNNPRLDMVGFAYHHSLMPLTCYESMRMQIKLHKEAYFDNWGTTEYSKGFFPPESSFASHMIPALVAEGIQWVFVDSGHFDRTFEDFPWSSASSIRPNLADVRNGKATDRNSSWVQLSNVWAPTPVAAPFSYQPHRVRYVDPNSDPANPTVSQMIAVPAARYEGNENGRGGYGAFKPQNVWGSQISKNNDANRPMIIVCHSDGDNFGMKNADAWNGQHSLFLDMIQSDPNFEHTTVQDYLDMYATPANDYIHVEPGSWIGIDGGTPYFYKWVEENAVDGEHPDMWSWSMIIAAQNRVIHADRLNNSYSMNDVRWGIGNGTAKAWHFYLQAETSCHWYWDFDDANPWDGNATRAANLSIAEANTIINANPNNDPMGPSIFPPQRRIWNPGGKHWNEAGTQPSDFDVWTFVDDVNGVSSVRLKWRTADYTSYKNINDYSHEIYAHTPGKNSPWYTVNMAGDWYPTVKGPKAPDPLARAMRYTGNIAGQTNTLISYFVEAVDTRGNTNRSIIQHVWVGSSSTTGASSYVTFDPPAPTGCNPVTIKYKKAGSPLGAGQVYIHVGRNNWQGTILPNPAMTDAGDYWTYTYNPPAGTIQINAAFNNGSGTWDSNGGQNWNVVVANCNENVNTDPAVTVSPAQPVQCQPMIVTYLPGSGALSNVSPVSIYQRFNGTSGSPIQNQMSPQGNAWVFTNTTMAGVTNVQMYFAGPGGTPVDNRGGSNWNYVVTICNTGNGPAVVETVPVSPSGCDPVTIRYKPNDGVLKTAQPVYIHIGRNGWKDVITPTPAMTLGGDGFWSYQYQPVPGTYQINFVFNNGAGVWDNNAQQDWNLAVTGCEVLSGLVITDPATNLVVSSATSAYIVEGQAGPEIVGHIHWTNSPLGVGGTFPAASNWQFNATLGFGTNVITVSGTNAASSVTTNASDRGSSSAYSDGWSAADNGGSGFGDWALYTSSTNGSQNGRFMATDAAVSIGTPAWGLYANSGNLSEAKRFLTNALAVGQTFLVSLDNGEIDTGSGVGVGLQNSSGDTLWQFFFNGGDLVYNISGNTTDVGWTSSGISIAFTLTGPTNYSAVITPSGGAARVISGHLDPSTNGQSITTFRAWNWNAGAGSTKDVFFNNLALVSPGGSGQSYSDFVVIVRASGTVDSDNDGIDDEWETQQFGNLTAANQQSDWDQDGVRDGDESRAGTDPKQNSSFPRAAYLEMRHGGGRVVIHWPGANGRLYDLYRSTDLLGNNMVQIGSNLPFMPSMNVFTDEVDGAAAQFYWIGVRKP